MSRSPDSSVQHAGDGLVRAFLAHRRQRLTDLLLFLAVCTWSMVQLLRVWSEGRLDFVEVSFAAQNFILVSLFLLRTQHVAFDESLKDQAVAIVAFFSGAAFLGQPATGGETSAAISRTIILAANALGIITLINLGRSFGVLIAYRGLRESGLYGVVRHPMYLTDLLLRVGYLVSHATIFIVCVFFLSGGCYVYRAILEERFLSRERAYAEYMQKVRYRFIPFVF